MLTDRKINKVVIVDDDPIHNFISKRLLGKLEVTNRLTIITNPVEAVSFVEQACINKRQERICPDLMFLDKMMPVMDGFEVLKEIKRKGYEEFNKEVLVVMVSAGNFRKEEEYELALLGVTEYIVKPLTEEKIYHILDKYFKASSA